MNTKQMELRLEAKRVRVSDRQKQNPKQRAQWWFSQMRRVVDAALEWQPTPSGRREQVYLALRN
jgi:hypothetical protein